MRKLFVIITLALIMNVPVSARADQEFLQKIQSMLATIQEKAKLYQEKVNELKTQVMQQVEQAKDAASKAKNAASSVKGELMEAAQGVVSGSLNGVQSLSARMEGISDPTEGTNKEEVAEEVSAKYNPPLKKGENTDEQYEEITQIKQELMQDAVSSLYGIGHAMRAKLLEEKAPRDVNMSDTGEIQRETNLAALGAVERLSQLYLMESMLQSYQFTQAMTDIKREAPEEEEE